MIPEPDEREVLLYEAIRLGDIKKVQKLIQIGANVNGSFLVSDRTPLGEAVYEGFISIVQILLDAGASPGCGKYGSTIYDAAANGDIEMIKLLIKAGTTIAKTDNEILDNAVLYGCFDIVRLLINLGVDVNTDREGLSYPLLIAARLGRKKIFNYLLPLTSIEVRREIKFKALLSADCGNTTAWNFLCEVEPKFTAEDKQYYFENYW